MLIVTAGTGDYREIILAQAKACTRFGHVHRVYDLGGLGFGEPFEVPADDLKPTINGDSLPPATFKARLLLDAFEPHACMCWLDADCLPLLDFMPPGEWDAAVTLRPASEVGACGIKSMDYLNAGVVWIRNIEFAREWLEMSIEANTDQGALNEIVAPDFGPNEWRTAVGHSIINPMGMSVLVLDAMEWNCWHLPPRPETRILHFKRGIRGAAKGYCQ